MSPRYPPSAVYVVAGALKPEGNELEDVWVVVGNVNDRPLPPGGRSRCHLSVFDR